MLNKPKVKFFFTKTSFKKLCKSINPNILFYEIYPTNPELKVEHNCIHATFLDLVVSLDKDKFIFKMFDKRDTFNFQIVRNAIN